MGYRPGQPVPYSHKLHVGELGLDCRYCHASIEISAVANVPPTKTCMNCHQLVKKDSELLAPIRDSVASGRPMRWIRVHKLPDFAYFAHNAHVAAGMQDLKKRSGMLARVAVFIICMRMIDLIWLVEPTFRPGTEFPIHWLDITLLVGLTGVWMFMFARNLRSRAILPVNDPYFREAFAHEAH